jgi:hypothetical protein
MNFGFYRKVLPENLFLKLKNECVNASPETHRILKSGLTRPGVPLHYYLKDNSDELKTYALSLTNDYFNEFQEPINFKLKTEGKPSKQFIPLDPWINIQKKFEYIPIHDHTGFCAYTIWVNIPESSIFEFTYSTITGEMFREQIHVTKEMEGTIMMFPSKLLHCVYPFFNSDENRISISGNINLE